MVSLCWDKLCGPDCSYCRYKQDRYRTGSSKPCYQWFAEKQIEKKCMACVFYIAERNTNPNLPDDPAYHPIVP